MNVHRPPPTPFFHSDLHCNADIVAASHSPSLRLSPTFSRACPTFAESRFNRTTSSVSLSLSLSLQAKFPSVIFLNRVLIHIGSLVRTLPFPIKT